MHHTVWLWDVVVAVSVQVSMQAAVVVDPAGPLISAGETGGVKLVRVWLVVLLGDRAVDRDGVGLGGPANCDADHRLGLEVGAVSVAVRLGVEVDARVLEYKGCKD